MAEIYPVNMPDIGEGVVEGEVVKWLKNEGEEVVKDEPVVVMMTDKATVELPSPEPGILQKQHYSVGEIAELGKPLYSLTVEKAPRQKVEDNVIAEKVEIEIAETGIGLATPRTRELAKRLGVNLSNIRGGGPGGRITDEDVVHYHAGKIFDKPTPALNLKKDERKPIIGIQKAMAEKMVESKTYIPHFSFFERLDATQLIKMKEKIASQTKKVDISLTYMPLLIRALSKTIQEHPEVNASIDSESKETVFHTQQNVGIAIGTKEGLIIAVLKGVESMSLEELIRSYDALIKRAKLGKLSRDEMRGSTITISNFGPLGGRWATPIINYPESAILGVAKIEDEVVARSGEPVVRPMMNLSWSFDHRLIDGYKAASISKTFKQFLENPVNIL